MSPLMIVLIIDAVLLAALLIVLLVKYCAKINKADQQEVAEVAEEVGEESVPEECESGVQEECAAEDAVSGEEVSASEDAVKEEEVSAAAEETVSEEEVEEDSDDSEDESDDDEKLVIGGLNINSDSKRTPFYEKMLYAEKKTQEYYNTLYNAFLMYRRINPRVSVKFVSFRFGRDLIAKITLHGKTMKLHLALDVNAYEENVYFQKDLSAKKAYAEVPFTVKVKSERGLKNALKLIDALMLTKGVEKKARHYVVDSIEKLKALKK